MNKQYPLLFSPVRIGPVTLRNRVASLGHQTAMVADGLPTDQMIAYHAERARGGTALIILEATHIHRSDGVPGHIWNWDDRIAPAYRKLSDAVHEHGAKIFAQLYHRCLNNRFYPGSGFRLGVTVRPSPDPFVTELGYGGAHQLEVHEIEELIEAFGKAAGRVKSGGLDGVEVLAAFGHLNHQFLSPYSNKRTDEFGGGIDGRMRFLLGIIDEVRSQIGDDLVLGIRISGDEFVDGGLRLEDMQEVAKSLQQTRKVDYLNVTAGNDFVVSTLSAHYGYMDTPLGHQVHLAAGIRSVVDLPIIHGGRIVSPDQAEGILRSGYTDVVGMARALIADPYFAKKAEEGRPEEIITCIGCGQGCMWRTAVRVPITCIQNPLTGRESTLGQLHAAKSAKKVVVVGGGPAGMEAAWVGAERGHRIVLFEKNTELGGKVLTAAKAPLMSGFEGVIRTLLHRLDRSQVEVHLGVEVTPEMVLAQKPDTVIVATGALPWKPSVPGIDSENVVMAEDVLEERVHIGDSVLVFDIEGVHRGTTVAIYLAEQGKQVEIVTPFPVVGWHLGHAKHAAPRVSIYQRLLSLGVVLTPHMELKAVDGTTVLIHDIYNYAERSIRGVDTVVIASPGVSNDAIYHALRQQVKELYAIGDCYAPRMVEDAIYEGYQVGGLI